MSTVRSTLDRPVDHASLDSEPDLYVGGTVIALDTPLMRSLARHPAGRGLRDDSLRDVRRRPVERPRPSAAGPADRTRGRGGYRLTRRGRLVVFLGTLLVCAGLTVGLGSQVIATSEPGEPVPSRPVTVQPGETVWDLAADANPDGDIRETVREIADLNALSSAGDVQAGSTVYVPVY